MAMAMAMASCALACSISSSSSSSLLSASAPLFALDPHRPSPLESAMFSIPQSVYPHPPHYHSHFPYDQSGFVASPAVSTPPYFNGYADPALQPYGGPWNLHGYSHPAFVRAPSGFSYDGVNWLPSAPDVNYWKDWFQSGEYSSRTSSCSSALCDGVSAECVPATGCVSSRLEDPKSVESYLSCAFADSIAISSGASENHTGITHTRSSCDEFGSISCAAGILSSGPSVQPRKGLNGIDDLESYELDNYDSDDKEDAVPDDVSTGECNKRRCPEGIWGPYHGEANFEQQHWDPQWLQLKPPGSSNMGMEVLGNQSRLESNVSSHLKEETLQQEKCGPAYSTGLLGNSVDENVAPGLCVAIPFLSSQSMAPGLVPTGWNKDSVICFENQQSPQATLTSVHFETEISTKNGSLFASSCPSLTKNMQADGNRENVPLGLDTFTYGKGSGLQQGGSAPTTLCNRELKIGSNPGTEYENVVSLQDASMHCLRKDQVYDAQTTQEDKESKGVSCEVFGDPKLSHADSICAKMCNSSSMATDFISSNACHNLSTSIYNLSKVLLAKMSLMPFDNAEIVHIEALQNSICMLSHCLVKQSEAACRVPEGLKKIDSFMIKTQQSSQEQLKMHENTYAEGHDEMEIPGMHLKPYSYTDVQNTEFQHTDAEKASPVSNQFVGAGVVADEKNSLSGKFVSAQESVLPRMLMHTFKQSSGNEVDLLQKIKGNRLKDTLDYSSIQAQLVQSKTDLAQLQSMLVKMQEEVSFERSESGAVVTMYKNLWRQAEEAMVAYRSEVKDAKLELVKMQEEVSFERSESIAVVTMYKNLWRQAEEAMIAYRSDAKDAKLELEHLKQTLKGPFHSGTHVHPACSIEEDCELSSRQISASENNSEVQSLKMVLPLVAEKQNVASLDISEVNIEDEDLTESKPSAANKLKHESFNNKSVMATSFSKISEGELEKKGKVAFSTNVEQSLWQSTQSHMRGDEILVGNCSSFSDVDIGFVGISNPSFGLQQMVPSSSLLDRGPANEGAECSDVITSQSRMPCSYQCEEGVMTRFRLLQTRDALGVIVKPGDNNALCTPGKHVLIRAGSVFSEDVEGEETIRTMLENKEHVVDLISPSGGDSSDANDVKSSSCLEFHNVSSAAFEKPRIETDDLRSRILAQKTAGDFSAACSSNAASSGGMLSPVEQCGRDGIYKNIDGFVGYVDGDSEWEHVLVSKGLGTFSCSLN